MIKKTIHTRFRGLEILFIRVSFFAFGLLALWSTRLNAQIANGTHQSQIREQKPLNKCEALSAYIEDSKSTTIGNDLSESNLFVVFETDSCLILSVQYNYADLEKYNVFELGYIAKYKGEYICLIRTVDILDDWTCLESIGEDKAHHHSMIKKRLLNTESLLYTTYKFPSRVIFK